MSRLTQINPFIGATLFICFFSFSALAQEDSISFQTTRDTAVKYVTPLEYAFMMHEETKFMLRVPVMGVGAEIEIFPYFTWMAQAYYPMFQLSSATSFPDINSEFRYYFSSRKLGVRNMSGNYLAAGFKFKEESNFDTEIPGYAYYAKWGMQRRILGNGLADIGIIAGFSSGQYEGQSAFGLFIKSPISLGFGFVFGERANLDRNRLCPVVKCHDVERFLLKVNFTDLINYHFLNVSEGQHHSLALKPNVSAEIKILESPFSFNLDLLLTLFELKVDRFDYQRHVSEYDIEGMAGVRWYYNMSRRMRLGKGGNGLSGNYLSGGLGSYYRPTHYETNTRVGFHETLFPFVSTGIQRTLGKRVYFDLNIGIRESGYVYRWTDLGIHKTKAEVFGNARIGIKF